MTIYQMTSDGVKQTVTFLGTDGEWWTVNSESVNFRTVLDAVLADDTATATENAIPLTTIVNRLQAADPRFGTDGDAVTLAGKPLSDRLSGTMLGYARQGNDALTGLANFVRRLSNNPSKRSVDQLYTFVEANGLTITPEGMLVAYKGVAGSRERGYTSVSSGTAFVNGVKHEGRIPNAVGDVVTMPRNEVQDDPDVHCHVGLHVGAHAYAASFGQHLLTVLVDPADVVSVPTDHNAQKMRVCRYVVKEVNESKGKFAHGVVTDFTSYQDGECQHECCQF